MRNTSVWFTTSIGPSGFARFMAGCNCENEDALYRDIEEYEEQQITITTGLPETSARQLARSVVERRRTEDNRYKETDKAGVEGEGPEFVFTKEGDVYFPQFDSTLGDMYERQKALRPQEYNETEHKTVMNAYRTLREGASQAAHVVHHFTEQGELDVRDAIVLTYDPLTKSGRMHILNISEEGNTHRTMESAVHALEKRLDGFVQQEQIDAAPIMTRSEDPIDPVSFFSHQEEKVEHTRDTVSSDRPQSEQVVHIPKYMAEDRFVPIAPNRTFRHADIPEAPEIPFRLPEFLQRLMDRDEQGRPAVRPARERAERAVSPIADISATPEEKPDQVRHTPVPRERSHLHAEHVSPKHGEIRVDEQKEYRVSQSEAFRGIGIAEKTGAGIGAVFVFLERIAAAGEPTPQIPATKEQTKKPMNHKPVIGETVLFTITKAEDNQGNPARANEKSERTAHTPQVAVRERGISLPKLEKHAHTPNVIYRKPDEEKHVSPKKRKHHLVQHARSEHPIILGKDTATIRIPEKKRMLPTEQQKSRYEKRTRRKERNMRRKKARIIQELMVTFRDVLSKQQEGRKTNERKAQAVDNHDSTPGIIGGKPDSGAVPVRLTLPDQRPAGVATAEQSQVPEITEAFTLVFLFSLLVSTDAHRTASNDSSEFRRGEPEATIRKDAFPVQLWMYLALIFYAGLLREHTGALVSNMATGNHAKRKRKRSRGRHGRGKIGLSKQGVIYAYGV